MKYHSLYNSQPQTRAVVQMFFQHGMDLSLHTEIKKKHFSLPSNEKPKKVPSGVHTHTHTRAAFRGLGCNFMQTIFFLNAVCCFFFFFVNFKTPRGLCFQGRTVVGVAGARVGDHVYVFPAGSPSRLRDEPNRDGLQNARVNEGRPLRGR